MMVYLCTIAKIIINLPTPFDTKVIYLKSVSARREALLNTELNIFTFGDLLQHFPFRYEDRTKYTTINDISSKDTYVQLKGEVLATHVLEKGKKRLVASFFDGTGLVDLVWFKGISWILSRLQTKQVYIVYGRPNRFQNKYNILHPEFELVSQNTTKKPSIIPVYASTEKLRKAGLDTKGIARLQATLLPKVVKAITETLPATILTHYNFVSKKVAIAHAHFPPSFEQLAAARERLKFEELFYIQLKIFTERTLAQRKLRGQVFSKIPTLNKFYKHHLPFALTNAQKRVIREIYYDLTSGRQMNRLLQGDVGSGKTIVAFVAMLIAIDNQAQACMMAPTEILVAQHYNALKVFANLLDLNVAKLTGATKAKERKIIDEQLREGSLKIIVGTHALIEDTVKFMNLGLCIIDEQHRFGVAQRAKLWKKNSRTYPHILVMTATPIPRTLAMTLYGDLDNSVIDQLPPGRKPVVTDCFSDVQRLIVWGFLRKQIQKGRQIYIVYPLIEESETLDYNNLYEGYESVKRAFPNIAISVLHSRMKAIDKDFEMKRFLKNETKIMVATTVIEVGVDVPNATVMVIENAERFGLSQLHQLRGRVGRGSQASHCILMTGNKVSKEAKIRLDTLVKTNDGFDIADVDLKLRGPGDLSGTQQSGVLDLVFADLSKDAQVLTVARAWAKKILTQDPELQLPEYTMVAQQISRQLNKQTNWSRIS